MVYRVAELLARQSAFKMELSEYFKDTAQKIHYSQKLPKNIRMKIIKSLDDLDKVLKGPGFYLIATDAPVKNNQCTLKLENELPVVYRGHSSHVRERIESHLFYENYCRRDSARKFSVCMKLNGINVNIDEFPFSKNQWLVVTHSMPKSTVFIREAAESGFDSLYKKPIGSNK